MSAPKITIWYVNVLVVATCGLVYELLAGTLASYLMGDSITQFSVIIGLYIFSLGIGAYVSGFVEQHLARRFLEVELAVALLGGLSAPILFVAFGHGRHFMPVLYGMVLLIGALVGLELPLLLRILREQLDFKDLVSRILSVDYLGGLVASIVFPLVCVPHLGLVRTSLVFGLLNAAVALWGTFALDTALDNAAYGLRWRAGLVMVCLLCGMWKADALTRFSEEGMFADDIVYSHTTSYQRIVITRGRSGFHLFLNGNLQFSSADEHRYHEALVHVPMQTHGAPRKVLVLGGGDGLALREILKWEGIESVTLVDLDPEMTGLSRRFGPLGTLNEHAFEDPRVHVVNADAMAYLSETPGRYDVALVDFPDPNNFALGKLYTRRFYTLLREHLTSDGVVSVQSTSPMFARASYWCIVHTMQDAGWNVAPYHVTVPSFGEWGFVLAKKTTLTLPTALASAPAGMRYLNDAMLPALFAFPVDSLDTPTEINRLDNQVLVRLYEEEWRRWD